MQDEESEPDHLLPEELNLPEPSKPPKSRKKLWLSLRVVVLIVLIAAGFWLWQTHRASPAKPPVAEQTKTPVVAGLQLQVNRNYGNTYSDGILPVGDGKYTTDTPETGYIYACGGYAQNIQKESGGAGKRGPWFTNNNTEYNSTKKLHVIGSVMWQAEFTNTVSGNTRTITTNDLPSHPTGIFPIQASDPAYVYDRNPNNIKGQTLTYAIAMNPTYGKTPACESGTVGIMLTGIQLNNGFDAAGRDAGAWEIQDSCDGHPQSEGLYHYHTLSSCIKDISIKTIIGYGLDGFPITGPQIAVGNILTTSDLDECHGIYSPINIGGKLVNMYHYVMTQDFPYSISCFRGTPISPPGEKPLPH